jgi:hypothetical protein
LVGSEFSVDFSGSGSADTASRSDHDHLGQTWTGSNQLTISGSFGAPDYAPLSLNNTRASGDGLRVTSAGDDGVEVDWAGNDGLWVNSAGEDGVAVSSAGRHGVYVNSATDSGLYVTSAWDGVHVASAVDDGVHVEYAHNYGVYVEEANFDGVRVESATGIGLSVGSALEGVSVYEARQAGVNVYEAVNGVWVTSAHLDGVWANTTDASGEWGFETADKIRAANVTASTLTLLAQVDGPEALTAGDVVAAAGVTEGLPDGHASLPTVRLADSQTWNGVIGVVEGRVALQPAPGKEAEGATVLRSVPGPARAGDYVALTVMGVAQVKVDPAAASILPGQRLTAAEIGGHARALRSESLNGMLVTEGAPVIGIALAAPTPGSDTIPVFVTLR